MIVSTLIAASVAAQPAPTPQPTASPAPAAEKKMACCDKMAKGEGCDCCKGMGKEHHGEHGVKDAREHAH
jgi:hypothetical protein